MRPTSPCAISPRASIRLTARTRCSSAVSISRNLDLSGLDFKGAKLAASNLFGSDLSRADLSKADLKGARLDRVTIIGARFDGADLSDASFLRPSSFSTLAAPVTEAPSFVGANLARTRLFGRFNRSNFRGADLSGAMLAPFNKTGFIEHIWRTELSGADLTGANLSGADLGYVLLSFANLRGGEPARRQAAKSRLVARRPHRRRFDRRRSGGG